MIRNFQGGLHAALDISVINPLQTLTVERAAEEPGYALSLRHNQKLRKYSDKCLAEGLQFCSVVVETTGVWHPEAEAFLKRLGVAFASATRVEEGENSRHMFGRLAILLQQDNINLILNRTPGATAPKIDGNL